MILEKRITDAKFVLSKDELPYAEILKDFKNAKYIYVLTYNISKKQHILIDALKECEKAKICIVSNIPGRWEKYFDNGDADKARKTIACYKARLDLKDLDLGVYFNFSNHAKIIMTENVVYVGSANYSEESANNFEAGLISRDPIFIDYLINDIFPRIIDSSAELKTDNELLLMRLDLTNALSEWIGLFEEIKYAFYAYSGHSTTSEIIYYRGNNEEFTTENIERIIECTKKYFKLLERTNLIFSRKEFSRIGIANLDSVISHAEVIAKTTERLFESSLFELASFSEEDIANQYLEDHYAEAYDEMLSDFAQEAVDLAVAEHERLAGECREDVDRLLELLKDMVENTENVLCRFKNLPLHLIRIDNTEI